MRKEDHFERVTAVTAINSNQEVPNDSTSRSTSLLLEDTTSTLELSHSAATLVARNLGETSGCNKINMTMPSSPPHSVSLKTKRNIFDKKVDGKYHFQNNLSWTKQEHTLVSKPSTAKPSYNHTNIHTNTNANTKDDFFINMNMNMNIQTSNNNYNTPSSSTSDLDDDISNNNDDDDDGISNNHEITNSTSTNNSSVNNTNSNANNNHSQIDGIPTTISTQSFEEHYLNQPLKQTQNSTSSYIYNHKNNKNNQNTTTTTMNQYHTNDTLYSYSHIDHNRLSSPTPQVVESITSSSSFPPISPLTPICTYTHDNTITNDIPNNNNNNNTQQNNNLLTHPLYKLSNPNNYSTLTHSNPSEPQSLPCYINSYQNKHSHIPPLPSFNDNTHNSNIIHHHTTTNTNTNTATTDPTVHAQTFVLALAFFTLWSPQNLMAPTLTQMADFFHFSPEQRDLYLGANIAFATGVLSLPVSALLGFYADHVHSRIQLFAFTVFAGGISTICTGYSVTYAQLFLARFACGGFMSGSVPIAFSILGDFFDAKTRNAASSGLTAMMGAGILFGQVYAGTVGDVVGWSHPFIVSGWASIVTSLMVLKFVREPQRGGKEPVLQEMLRNGQTYDRKLTVESFIDAMTKNRTNVVLMIQGFVTNIPWGIIFTFLNDFLSQEQGLSVPASTFLVLWFGIGSASGGILGGYFGTKIVRYNRSFLPIFMSFSTLFGIFPFLGLLNMNLSGTSVFTAVFLSFAGGCIANFPSVNIRPCLLNVNRPEARGAAMTAANLLINVARGAGPSLITMTQRMYGASRQESFNFAISFFWCVASLLLLILAKTLPQDQDAMDSELELYARNSILLHQKSKMATASMSDDLDIVSIRSEQQQHQQHASASVATSEVKLSDDIHRVDTNYGIDDICDVSVVSIEDRMTSFDAAAVQESLRFIGDAWREIGSELSQLSHLGPIGYYHYHTIEPNVNRDHNDVTRMMNIVEETSTFNYNDNNDNGNKNSVIGEEASLIDRTVEAERYSSVSCLEHEL